MSDPPRVSFWLTLLYGVVSLGLYLLLFLNAKPLLQYTLQGRWHFIVPVGIAFLFATVHGQFTGRFWAHLGLKPKSRFR